MRRVVVCGAILAVASCDEADAHILSGRLYQPGLACIEPSASVDVVDGPSTGDDCSPRCLSLTTGDAAVYVTTTCPPYPGDYAVESEDASADAGDPCVGAFAAYDQGDATCPANLGDGGSD